LELVTMSGNTPTLFSVPRCVPRKTFSMIMDTFTIFRERVNRSRGFVIVSWEPVNMAWELANMSWKPVQCVHMP
jgi:hypothetical protein